jgi:hypothetical protein
MNEMYKAREYYRFKSCPDSEGWIVVRRHREKDLLFWSVAEIVFRVVCPTNSEVLVKMNGEFRKALGREICANMLVHYKHMKERLEFLEEQVQYLKENKHIFECPACKKLKARAAVWCVSCCSGFCSKMCKGVFKRCDVGHFHCKVCVRDDGSCSTCDKIYNSKGE